MKISETENQKMYDETPYFDPHDPHHMPGGAADGPSQTVINCTVLSSFMGGSSSTSSHNSLEENLRQSILSLEDLSNHHNPSDEAVTAAASVNMGIDLQQQLGYELEHDFDTHMMQEVIHDPNTGHLDQPNWESSVQEMHDMSFHNHNQQQQQFHLQQQQQPQIEMQQNLQCLNSTHLFVNPQYTPTPDLLNLLHLPTCSVSSMLPNSSMSFSNMGKKVGNFSNSLDILSELQSTGSSPASVLYDPSLHLNLPPQPLFRELFHSLPHNYSLPGSRGSSFFSGMDESEGLGVYQEGDGRHFENEVLDFRRDINGLAKGSERGTNHFATEKQRREQLNEKYEALKLLVPNRTKSDRASVVGDAIEYIKELLRTVEELKILVEQKRCGRSGRSKRAKTEDETAADMENSSIKPLGILPDRENSYNGSLRSSWLQRKSKEIEVDVRIIDNEVTIKLVQRKKMNCLLFVSKILDELQLDLLHVAGGNIGDYYSFLFNTKIYEGSSVYASAIAMKLIEVVDRQYAAFPPGSL